MFNKHFVGLDLTGFEDNGAARPISRVTLLVDDDNAITAGDDTGLEITADCPHATQPMVDAILASVKGYTYRMYEADAATLDPTAELGDGITVGGLYSVISRIDDDGIYPNVAAPGQAELEDEYPSEGPVTRSFNRKIADTRATITKTAEEIRLEVQKADEALSSRITQTATEIRQEVQNADEALSARITVNANAIEQRVTKSDFTAYTKITDEAIEQRVTKGGVISAINQSPEQITIQAGRISLEGIVTVNQTFQIDKSGYLTCTGGTIGGFTIGSSALYNGQSSFKGASNGVYIGTNGISLGANGKFSVTSGGVLNATGATISGSITANSGTIGGFTINQNSLTAGSGNTAMSLSPNGLSIGNGKFYVDANGKLTATSGTFSGEVWAKNIKAGATEGYITNNQLSSSNTYGGYGNGNIGQGAVGNVQLQSSAVHGTNIQDGAVSNGKIAESAVTSGKIQNSAVGTAQIANSSVTQAKLDTIYATNADIGSLKADVATINKIVGGSATTSWVQSNSVTTTNLYVGGRQAKWGTIKDGDAHSQTVMVPI